MFIRRRTLLPRYQKAFWGAIGAIGGALIGGLFSKKGQEDTNTASAQESETNRQWQEKMAKNRHQYEVEDLRKAGLNPILSARSGASVPSGSQASFQNPNSAFAEIGNRMADIRLKKALSKTERTKQDVNQSQKAINEQIARSQFYQQEMDRLSLFSYLDSTAFRLSKTGRKLYRLKKFLDPASTTARTLGEIGLRTKFR